VINKTYQKVIILPLVLLISISVQAKPEVIWKKQADYIAINTLNGANNNNHPKEISVEKIARLLSQVQVKNSSYNTSDSMWDDDAEVAVRVFTDREIDLLGNKLSQAFKQVKSNEVITFSVSDFRSAYIGRKRLSISGSIFIKNNKLNLLIGAMHADLIAEQRRSGITGNYGRLKNNLSNGDIQGTSSNEWQLIHFSGADLVDNRTDWLSIDLQKTYQYATLKKDKQSVDSKYLTEQQQAQSSTALEARIIQLEQERDQSTHINDRGESIIEGRLRQLQALYDTGALPETIYLEKVRSIMAEL